MRVWFLFCFFVLFYFSDQPTSAFPSAGIKGLFYHHLARFVLETALYISGWLQIAKDNLAGVYVPRVDLVLEMDDLVLELESTAYVVSTPPMLVSSSTPGVCFRVWMLNS